MEYRATSLHPVQGDPYVITPEYLDESSPNRPGPCGDQGCWEGVKGLMIERSGSPTMDARAIRRHLNESAGESWSVSHFLVDDQRILQLLPIGEIGPHGIKNRTHLAVQLCEQNWGSPEWRGAYQRLVWLTARLLFVFQLPVARMEGRFWWDRTHPYDPTHLGWSAEFGRATGLFDWNQFIADVSAQAVGAPGREAPTTIRDPAPPMATPVKPAMQKGSGQSNQSLPLWARNKEIRPPWKVSPRGTGTTSSYRSRQP